MNIVLGVSGEGLGHSFEAIEIIRLLRANGHAVKVLTFGDRACNCLKEFSPTRIEGFSLYVNANGLAITKILYNNLRCISFYLKNWRRLERELRAYRPDVFITFYELFTTLWSHRLKKPLISMDNQNLFLHIDKPKEISTFQFQLTRLVTKAFTFGAAHYIIKCVQRPQQERHNTNFVSPHIQEEIRKLSPGNGEHILVYLTQPNPHLIDILKTIRYPCIVYCNNQVGEDQNLIFRKPGPQYLTDLSECRAIIGTTGFSLINDSIYLKKPYFGVPIGKHFEQIHNAYFLRNSGLGEFSLNPTKGEIEAFLGNLPTFRSRLDRYRLDFGAYGEALIALLEKMGQPRCPAAESGPGPFELPATAQR